MGVFRLSTVCGQHHHPLCRTEGCLVELGQVS